MKIAYFFHSLAAIGGIERVLIDKMNYLSTSDNYEVYIITYEQSNIPIPYPLSPKVKHIDLDVPFYGLYKYSPIKRLFYISKIKKELQNALSNLIEIIKPEIIITTVNRFYDVNAVISLQDTSKKILESHSAKQTVGEFFFFRKREWIRRFIAKCTDKHFFRLIKKSSALVVLTNEDKKGWKEIKESIVIPNILTHYPSELKQFPKQKRVIAVGRLTEQKGFDLLIDAWKEVHLKHPNWLMQIYGSGEDEEFLKLKIKENQLIGSILINKPTNMIYDEYMKSDFFVLSSRWEGFGLVLIEAMSCGIPCVSFDCPNGPADVITNNEDGIIVENGNIEQLAEKINFMIENESIRQEMGRKARNNVKRYLPEHIMPKWLDLFNHLSNEK